MPGFPPVHKYFPLVVRQKFSRQSLVRKPEPKGVMDEVAQVIDFDQATGNKLAIVYAFCLELIFRSRQQPYGGMAVDLACGTGRFTIDLARRLNMDSVEGLDLSPAMIDTAQQHAREQHCQNVRFRKADILRVDAGDDSVDVCTLLGAAHHLDDQPSVRRVLAEMDRVARADGCILIMDLARFRSAEITERYVKLQGQLSRQHGLHRFYEDFHNSLYAAWTVDELAQCIPATGKRRWRQLIPLGLPALQLFVGFPSGRRRLLVRRGTPWDQRDHPVVPEYRSEWKFLRGTIRMGRQRSVGNGKVSHA